jgi:uncharacterized membrane protein YdjX (TVP38/TMEM64 family)
MVATGLALELSGMRKHFSLSMLREQFEAHLVQGALVFIVLFALANLAHFPGVLMLSSAVLTLGTVGGAALTYVAAVISCAVTYFVIRALGADALRHINNRHAALLLHQLHTHPVRSVALLRLFMQTLPTLNCALALSGVRFRDYMIGTVIGLPVPIALYAIFFDAAVTALHLPHY